MRILFVEDDLNFAAVLTSYLADKGYDVTHADNGIAGSLLFKKEYFDLCILDVMLPAMDGYELGAALKQLNKTIPVIFLTAKNMRADIIRGFNTGADDYLIKPFDPEILHLKLQALKARVKPETSEKGIQDFTIGKLKFNSLTRELLNDNQKILLSPKEARLLELFCNSPDGVILKPSALISLWKSDNYFASRSMDVYIVRLRKKLAADPNVQIINLYEKGLKLFVKTSIL